MEGGPQVFSDSTTILSHATYNANDYNLKYTWYIHNINTSDSFAIID